MKSIFFFVLGMNFGVFLLAVISKPIREELEKIIHKYWL